MAVEEESQLDEEEEAVVETTSTNCERLAVEEECHLDEDREAVVEATRQSPMHCERLTEAVAAVERRRQR